MGVGIAVQEATGGVAGRSRAVAAWAAHRRTATAAVTRPGSMCVRITAQPVPPSGKHACVLSRVCCTCMDVYLDRAARLLRDSAGPLSVVELTEHAAGQWSIAETIEHLARTFSGTSKGFVRVLAAGAPAATRASLRGRAAALLVIDCGYFPTGRNSPPMALPRGVEPGRALPLALENLAVMDEALARAAIVFGTRVHVLDHPVLGPLSVRQWRKFHWVHTRHHARQIVRRTTARSGDGVRRN